MLHATYPLVGFNIKMENKEGKRICAFIDSLGTSEVFRAGGSEKKSNLLKLIRSISNKSNDHGLNIQNHGFAITYSASPQITTFSDNIALSIPLNEHIVKGQMAGKPHSFAHSPRTFFTSIITQIISISWEALRYGILFRGGITFGDLIHDNKVIAGNALVEAATLEKNTKFPRIEIQKEIMSIKDLNGETIIDDELKKWCFEEIDGKWFVKCFSFHRGVFTDFNFFQNENGLTEYTDIRDILKFYSKVLKKEYLEVKNSGNIKGQEYWIWFLNDLERHFKTCPMWQEMENSFQSMFGEILSNTDWKEKL